MTKSTLNKFFNGVKNCDFQVKYWEGSEETYGDGPPKAVIRFCQEPPSDFRLENNVALSFGEAYMDGLLDFEGSFDELISMLERNKAYFVQHGRLGKALSGLHGLLHLRSTDTKRCQKRNIQHHYDLGNDFYSLWLDPTMSYSCAYFNERDLTLEQAQLSKVDYLLKKLNLRAGERLLDIGSGWGWLITQAAKKYGVKAVGITLSEEQFKGTQERINRMGLADRVEVRLMNYLDLNANSDRFHKVVSVGMFEHVGKRFLGRYFKKVNELLVDGGLSVLHSITTDKEHSLQNGWGGKYIFPGGYIPSLRETVGLLPEYDLRLLHMESLRLHYAKTLDCWYTNFLMHLDEIKQKFDDRFIRMWSLYLLGSAAYFRTGYLDINQLILSKGVNNQLPITFEHLYSD